MQEMQQNCLLMADIDGGLVGGASLKARFRKDR